MRNHKTVYREKRDHKRIEIYGRSQGNIYIYREKRSQGNIEMIYLKAVCIYIERDNKALEIHEISQGS